MRSIKRISAMTLIYARKHSVKKKTRDLMTAVTISTAGAASIYNSSKVVPQLMADEFLRSSRYIAEPAAKKLHFEKIKTLPAGFDWLNMKPSKQFEPPFSKGANPSSDIFKPVFWTEENAADAIETTMRMIFAQKAQAVTRIMEEDKNFTSHNIKDTIAAQIVRIAQKYEMNPVHIACIAKKETHLTPNLNGNGTKGMMQVTMGALRPMYKYPQNFSPKLDEIKKLYPTAGELFEELGKNPELNLEVGTIYFQTCMRICKGNLLKALEMYNNSANKEQYAKDVLKNIKRYS